MYDPQSSRFLPSGKFVRVFPNRTKKPFPPKTKKGLSVFIQSSPGYGLREKEKKN